MSLTECAHGVDVADFCIECAHHPEEEWIGYPATICPAHLGGQLWPCDYERARRARIGVGPEGT